MPKTEETKEIAVYPLDEWAIITSNRGERIINALIANVGDDGFSQFNLDRIMPPQGSGAPQFTIPGLEEPQYVKSFEGVIVNVGTGRVYFESDDPKKGTPPDCSSDDAKIGFGRDDIERGTAKLANGGYTCATCAFAQFGSSKRGKGQACKLTKPLYVVLPDAEMPRLFMVTPSALKTFVEYGRRLGFRGYFLHEVVTRFSLEKDESSSGIDYWRATFEFAGTISDEQVAKIENFATGVKQLASSAPQLAAGAAEDEMTF